MNAPVTEGQAPEEQPREPERDAGVTKLKPKRVAELLELEQLVGKLCAVLGADASTKDLLERVSMLRAVLEGACSAMPVARDPQTRAESYTDASNLVERLKYMVSEYGVMQHRLRLAAIAKAQLTEALDNGR